MITTKSTGYIRFGNLNIIAFVVALVALFGTITNFVYASAIVTPLALGFFFRRDYLHIHKLSFFLAIYFLATVTSVLLYYPQSLLEFDFYRRDGNIFIAYAPLLILPALAIRVDLDKILSRYLAFVLTIYAAVLGVFLYRNGLSFWDETNTFAGLFVARNAAGGFLATITALAFTFYWQSKKLYHLIAVLFSFFLLLLTYSRGSIAGLLIGVLAWVAVKNNKMIFVYLMIIAAVISTVAALAFSYGAYDPITAGEFAFIGELETTKDANIAIRVLFTWPKALYLFLQSPLVGTGFGSFDDEPFAARHIFPLIAFNGQTQKIFSDAHAHHTYLHLLAEQGVLGLVLFLAFWVSIFRVLGRRSDFEVARNFLIITYFCLTFESFTEHRIATPSNALPFSLILGLYCAATKRRKVTIDTEAKNSEPITQSP